MPDLKTEILAEVSAATEAALREAAKAANITVEELAGRIIEQGIQATNPNTPST